MNEKDELQQEATEQEELEELEELENLEDMDGLTLEDILKEFGGSDEPDQDLPEDQYEDDVRIFPETAENREPVNQPVVSGDTIRLDDVTEALKNKNPDCGEPEQTADEKSAENVEPFSEEWEPDYDAPMGDYIPPEPIVFLPKSRLREMKRKLVEGPERRYYELSEQGIGKLQIGIFLNFLVLLLTVGSTALYGLNMIPENRMKLLIFAQVFAMLLAGLLGSFRLLEGAAHLLKGRFSMDTLLLVTFLACCADGVFCLMEIKVPCCAAFSLEMLMCQWSVYHRRVTEMGQMDSLRKAIRLDGLVKCPDFYEGRPGLLRTEAQVDDFMDHYKEEGKPEKILRWYGLTAVGTAAAVGIVAGVLHDPVLGVRAFAATLLAAVPATAFITLTRPQALLEKRLHSLGTVICGWHGVSAMSGPMTYPLTDQDLFPAGCAKMNGVKFYGDRDPDEVVAYAAALIQTDGGGLCDLFNQLLDSRNGIHYEVENFRCYGKGGIGGEICGEPVLVGVQPFLQEMGVEMPEGTRVNQAVYAAIDGDLCGVFAITYGKTKASAEGLSTLCSYRGLTPVLTTGDFMMTESFLRGKFGVNTRRMAFPERKNRDALASVEPVEEPAAVLMTKDGLAGAAFGVTGARALHAASVAGTAVHLAGGILGLCMMLTLAVLGAEELLTPVNLLLYQLLWIIPGLLITEWTRSI